MIIWLTLLRNQAIVSRGQHEARHAKSILYPTLPNPVLALSLPLTEYQGTYSHPGYQVLTVALDVSTNTLYANRSSSIFPEYMTFEHVSGGYFLIRSEVTGDLNELFPQVYPAEFRIDSSGQVKQVGISWEPEMGEEKIWLTRVSSS